MVPYVAPWEREARGFLETLFPTTLAGGEQIEARWKPPNPGKMRREFFADPQEVPRFASKLRNSHDVYIRVAPRQGVPHPRDPLRTVHRSPSPPSIVVWTGGGLHLYWLREESVQGHETFSRPIAAVGIPWPTVPTSG